MGRALLTLLLVFLAAGCAKVEPAADFAKMAAVVAEREGAQPLWRRTPEDDAAVAGQAAAVAARGMTLADAVRLALVNNPGVQARFEDIGVARSEVVQAGLPQNPSLAVLFGFPLFAGGPLGSFAATAMTSVSDLAQIKDRTAKAQAELERDILLIGQQAMGVAREARIAWLELAYARRGASLAGDRDVRGDLDEFLARRHGNRRLADRMSVTHTRKHICDGVGHAHFCFSPLILDEPKRSVRWRP